MRQRLGGAPCVADDLTSHPRTRQANCPPGIRSMNRRTFLQQTLATFCAASPIGLRSARAADPKRKTVLLKSAWQTINIGDIGHTPGTLRILEQYVPDAHVILWAASLNEPVEAML